MKFHRRFGQISYVTGRLILVIALGLWGETRMVSAAASQPGLIVGTLQVFEDPSAAATFAEIQARRAQFTDLGSTTPNFGFTASAYWLRIPVQNQSSTPARFYLDLKNPGLDHVALYVVTQGLLQETIRTGDTQARPYLAITLALPFELAAGVAAELYVQVQSDGAALFIPLAVLDETAFHATAIFNWVLQSIFLGIMGALFVYNLFIFSLLRTRLYLYYVLYLPVIYLAMAGISGFGPAYLYPHNNWLGNQGVGVFTFISFALLLLMTRAFLQTGAHRWLDRTVQLLIGSSLAVAAGVFLWPPRFGYQLAAVVLFLFPLFCFGVGVIAWRYGRREARFYLVGQMTSWLSMVLFALLNTGLISYRFLIYQSPILGVAGDALLLSLALADRIRLLQQAQSSAEEQARQNLEIRGEELERLVAARTAEIKTLHGVLPICANCKKIRDDHGAWQGLESYISQHTDAEFSHGICNDCMRELYPAYYEKRQQ